MQKRAPSADHGHDEEIAGRILRDLGRWGLAQPVEAQSRRSGLGAQSARQPDQVAFVCGTRLSQGVAHLADIGWNVMKAEDQGQRGQPRVNLASRRGLRV